MEYKSTHSCFFAKAIWELCYEPFSWNEIDLFSVGKFLCVPMEHWILFSVASAVEDLKTNDKQDLRTKTLEERLKIMLQLK